MYKIMFPLDDILKSYYFKVNEIHLSSHQRLSSNLGIFPLFDKEWEIDPYW